MRDLVVLTADQDAQFALQALLARPRVFGVRAIAVEKSDIFRHVQHDSGVLRDAAAFLRPFLNSHRFALVCFDHEGCGRENLLAEELEAQMEENLGKNGWNGRCAAVVFEPEVERWLWNGSPVLAQFLKSGTYSRLRVTLEEEGFLLDEAGKPVRPKEAFCSALRRARIPRSSSLYAHLATELSAAGCQERGFLKMKETFLRWFSAGNTPRPAPLLTNPGNSV